MPRGNRMGPMGQGPMTGRAAGYCAGNPTAGFMNAAGGRGNGRGHGGLGQGGGGGGWRHRHCYYATGLTGWQRGGGMGWPGGPVMTPGQALEALKQEAHDLEQTLGGLRERIEEMETRADGSGNP